MTEMLTRSETGLDLTPLRSLLDGDVVGPGDADWDEARRAWNLTVDQWPAAVALPENADSESVEATMNNGVLEVKVGKRESAKPRKIPLGQRLKEKLTK